jgi:isoleucyl-tRNA synthetase
MDKETLAALTPIKLRQKAAKFAKATVDAQMKSFKVILSFFVMAC